MAELSKGRRLDKEDREIECAVRHGLRRLIVGKSKVNQEQVTVIESRSVND